jgi:capsular exopolysaccharide synthesis family protein
MQEPRLPEAELEAGQEGGGLDVRRLLLVVLKHRWSIIGLTLLITLVSAFFVFRQVPVYKATATLQIERAPVQFSPLQDPYAAYQDHWLYYQTQYGLIKRRAIGERVVAALGMDQPSPVVEKPAQESFSWKSLLPADWFPDPLPPSHQQQVERRINWIVNGIQVSPIRDSQLVQISFADTNPQKAAELANAVARAYIQDNLAGRLDMSESASTYLTQRLVELRENLSVSEAALQAYIDSEKLIDVRGNDNLANQELSLATEKAGTAGQQRMAAEVLVTQVREARQSSERSLSGLPAILAHPQVAPANQTFIDAQRRVAELGRRYGPRHPQMIAANSELQAAVEALNLQIALAADSIERGYETALAGERAANQALASVKQRLREIDRKGFDLQTLEREVEANRQIYEKFQNQFKETDATGGVQSANARIVELARAPSTPFKPNKRRSLTVAFIVGLILSLGLAFLLEHLDNTLKSAEDVERRLSVPVLGLLPKLKVSGEDELEPLRYFYENKSSVFAESIRTVRTGVLLSALDDTQKVLLVTSSVPGEGKTTLSMNLAHALAEMKQVLLIDADMRRPTVARVLKGSGAEKGLSHFISGESNLSDCVTSLHSNTMHVMHAGLVPPNPLEMLSSQRFKVALDRMAEQFDHIIIDCAPALAVSDAMVLSKLATSVVYVVRSDSTPVQAAQAGLKRLRRVGAHVIGAVINQAERRAGSSYGKYSGYYSDGYYADYGYVRDAD